MTAENIKAMRAAAGLKLGAARVIVPEVLVVHNGHANFRFQERPVVIGKEGLFLSGTPILRKDTDVTIDIRLDGVETQFRAVVDESLEGIGTAFRFTGPNDALHAILQWLEGTMVFVSG